jgi:hypothetical protein
MSQGNELSFVSCFCWRRGKVDLEELVDQGRKPAGHYLNGDATVVCRERLMEECVGDQGPKWFPGGSSGVIPISES